MRNQRLLGLFLLAATLTPLCGQEVKRTFAVRIDGRVVGHTTETEEPATHGELPAIRFRTKTLVKLEVLGASIDQRIDQTWLLAKDTRDALSMKALHEAGATKIELAGRREDAVFKLDDGSKPLDPKAVVIAPDLRWLRERGPKSAGEVVETDQLVPELGGVHRVRVTLADPPDREVDVLGTKTPVRVYRLEMPTHGVDQFVFVRTNDFEFVRLEMPAQKLVMDRVAPAVVDRIERFDMTSTILVKTNLDIEDPSVLTSMKLRADVEATPDVTVESLNVPGQTFEGTVKGGRIEGVFTIRPPRIDAAATPPWPVPDGVFAAAELKPYLAPEEAIESDHTGIAGKARELAEGALTCLEVVERLARWSHDEIPYDIPGGGSAKLTFETRRGECGGHSRVLAAMLRSLGIPARTPMGGMYVPLYGGSFGQHMWTEVWLGKTVGWQPVDCTAGQLTFVDASHIRLSDKVTSFRPKSIEVLDHEPKAAPAAVEAVARRTDAYPFSAGETMTYVWSLGGQQLGDERITYRGSVEGAHVFESELSLQSGMLVETTRTRTGDDGRVLAFHAERTSGPLQETFDVTVADGAAQLKKKSVDGERSDAVRVEPSGFVLHNNCTIHFALVTSRLGPLVEGTEHKVRLLHTEQRSVFPMTLSAKGCDEIDIGGAKVQARVVEVLFAGVALTLHVDDQGRLLRFHQKQGDVKVELSKLR